MNSQQNIKIFKKMSRWLKSLNLDKESYNHTLYSLYMTLSYINSRNINHIVIYIIQLIFYMVWITNCLFNFYAWTKKFRIC